MVVMVPTMSAVFFVFSFTCGVLRIYFGLGRMAVILRRPPSASVAQEPWGSAGPQQKLATTDWWIKKLLKAKIVRAMARWW